MMAAARYDPAVEADSPRRRTFDTGNAAQKCGLAAARWSEEHREAPGLGDEGDSSQSGFPAIPTRERFNFQPSWTPVLGHGFSSSSGAAAPVVFDNGTERASGSQSSCAHPLPALRGRQREAHKQEADDAEVYQEGDDGKGGGPEDV